MKRITSHLFAGLPALGLAAATTVNYINAPGKNQHALAVIAARMVG
jgi:hypothetical protein